MPGRPVCADTQAPKLRAWPSFGLSPVRTAGTTARAGEALSRDNWGRTSHWSNLSASKRAVMSNWRQQSAKGGGLGSPTMTVLVASKNPVKVDAVTTAFQRLFPATSFNFQSVGVPSDVSEQPFSNEETLQGARNRVKNALEVAEAADFVVAIEGGVEWCSFSEVPQLMCFAWAVVLSKDMEGKARTAAFLLPPPLAELIAGGMEMAEADNKLFGRSNSKFTNGTVGLLTNDHITRKTYYEHAMTMALIPFINPELFSSPSVPVLPAGVVAKYD